MEPAGRRATLDGAYTGGLLWPRGEAEGPWVLPGVPRALGHAAVAPAVLSLLPVTTRPPRGPGRTAPRSAAAPGAAARAHGAGGPSAQQGLRYLECLVSASGCQQGSLGTPLALWGHLPDCGSASLKHKM